MVVETALVLIFTIVLLIILSSLPLYLAVKLLGGKTTIMRVFLTNIVVAVIISVLASILGLGWVWLLILTVLLYSYIFSMGIIRAFIAWLLQYVFALVLFILIVMLLGISIPTIVL